MFQKESKGFCCRQGKISVPFFQPLDNELKKYFISTSEESKHFLSHSRVYNSAFSLCSVGAKYDKNLANSTTGVYTFRVQGTISHLIGSILPATGEQPKFLQIYFVAPEDQSRIRCTLFQDLKSRVMSDLQNILLRINPMLPRFSVLGSLSDKDIHIKFSLPEYVDGRRYNKPTVEEVAAIIPTCNLSTHRDIIVECQNNGTRNLKRIYETNALYDPLAYPLIHLNGEQGWTLDLKQNDGGTIRV
jgi:hypothetical protein